MEITNQGHLQNNVKWEAASTHSKKHSGDAQNAHLLTAKVLLLYPSGSKGLTLRQASVYLTKNLVLSHL